MRSDRSLAAVTEPSDPTAPPADPLPGDPVRARRRQIAKWTLIANRVGYLLFGLAIALFVMAFAFSFNSGIVTLITVCLVLGSILLAPAIVLGYAVKAAEKDDRARGL
jgi:hypothetical protein